MNWKKTVILSVCSTLFVSTVALSAADKDSEAVPSLDSANPSEQVAACRLAGAKEDKDSVGKLVSLLETTSNPDVAAAAAAALGAIGEKKDAVEALLRVVGKSESVRVQYAGILALANLRDSDNAESVDSLIAEVGGATSDELLKDLAAKLQARFSK